MIGDLRTSDTGDRILRELVVLVFIFFTQYLKIA